MPEGGSAPSGGLDARELALSGVWEIRPRRHVDERGFFSETWSRQALRGLGLDVEFVQDNHSLSKPPGVLRGLHFQLPPFAQDKLVRVVRGAVFDVAVDIRRTSPTFGAWVGIELSAAAGNQIFVPKGFAHGLVTLVPGTEVLYKVSAPYSAAHDRAIRFDDPALAIAWPLPEDGPILSDKDREAPRLSAVEAMLA